MVSGLYTARDGMMILQEMVDNTTNNLANANTSGFKKSLAVSMARVQNNYNDQSQLSHDESHWMVENRIDWTPGSMVQTGNPMDVALEGDGFLTVETPNGDVRYTRAGSLTRNGMGELVTLAGDKVLDQSGGPILTDGSSFQVSTSGEISTGGDRVANLKIVDFADRSLLQREGGNLYSAPEEADAQLAENVQVRQGFVESSNVNAVEGMVELIRFQRNYEMDQKAARSEDETLQKAVNDIGRVS
ncbi:MAG TPA: flagellar basal-body rod protein FlgF [Fibrobacteraceae bacterium]|nr:flagellar basal-body rod protein FlgF [Fibrobacteraceae bacterium]